MKTRNQLFRVCALTLTLIANPLLSLAQPPKKINGVRCSAQCLGTNVDAGYFELRGRVRGFGRNLDAAWDQMEAKCADQTSLSPQLVRGTIEYQTRNESREEFRPIHHYHPYHYYHHYWHDHWVEFELENEVSIKIELANEDLNCRKAKFDKSRLYKKPSSPYVGG